MRRVFPANSIARCPVCGVHLHLCFCTDFLVFATRTRFVFLQHQQEALKPTNSVRLACRILSNTSILPWSRTDPPSFGPSTILLYPSPDATEISESELSSDCTIVIPDGTWSQTSRMVSVLSRNLAIPKRVLPPGALTAWTVRQSDDPSRVSSAQAAAAVLALAGENQAASALHEAVAEASRRILAMRGVVRASMEAQPPATI